MGLAEELSEVQKDLEIKRSHDICTLLSHNLCSLCMLNVYTCLTCVCFHVYRPLRGCLLSGSKNSTNKPAAFTMSVLGALPTAVWPCRITFSIFIYYYFFKDLLNLFDIILSLCFSFGPIQYVMIPSLLSESGSTLIICCLGAEHEGFDNNAGAGMHQSAQFASTWRVPVEGALARGPMEQDIPAGEFRRGHGSMHHPHPHNDSGDPFTPGTPDEELDEEYEWDNGEYGEEEEDDGADEDSAEELHGDTGNFGEEPNSADGGVEEGAVKKKKSSWRFWDKKT